MHEVKWKCNRHERKVSNREFSLVQKLKKEKNFLTICRYKYVLFPSQKINKFEIWFTTLLVIGTQNIFKVNLKRLGGIMAIQFHTR